MDQRELKNLEKIDFWKSKITTTPDELHDIGLNRAGNLFDRIGDGINQAMNLFSGNSDKFDRTFDSKEADDFLKKFK